MWDNELILELNSLEYILYFLLWFLRVLKGKRDRGSVGGGPFLPSAFNFLLEYWCQELAKSMKTGSQDEQTFALAASARPASRIAFEYWGKGGSSGGVCDLGSIAEPSQNWMKRAQKPDQ